MTYDNARKACLNRGMRLCTAMELREAIPVGADITKQLGAQCWGSLSSKKLFWSLKPCAEPVKWDGDHSKSDTADREIYYHVVNVPYTGTPLDKVNFNSRNAQKNAAGGFWPDTTSNGDVCESRKASKNKKHYVACCADEGGKYCHPCPKNSCSEDVSQGVEGVDYFKCESDKTKNTDCRCDKGFNYNIDQYTVCRPEVTAAPTTKAPTDAPTASTPEYNFCPANMFWNGEAPIWDAGQNSYDFSGNKGHVACDFLKANTLYNVGAGFPPKKVLSGKNTNNGRKAATGNTKAIDMGPPKSPPDNCRGWGLNTDTERAKNHNYKNEWTRRSGIAATNGELMCGNTGQRGGDRYWKEKLGAGYEAYADTKTLDVPNCDKALHQCCSKQQTWSEAVKFCAAFGYRLCSTNELRLSCVERTGCDYDYTWVWSFEPCTVPGGAPGAGSPGHFAMPGDARKWVRKLSGDCGENAKACVREGNAADGFGPTTDTGANDFQQGMPNQEDLYAIAWSGYPEQWFSAAGKRMTYMNAMKDLFGWDISTWNDASVTNPGVSAHNPTDDADGKVCIPDDGTGTLNNEGVFVRCCADSGWDCLKCPSGTFNAAGNGKTIYSCQ